MIEIMFCVPGEEEKSLEWEGRQFISPCSFSGRKDILQGQRTVGSGGQAERGRAEAEASWGQGVMPMSLVPCPLLWELGLCQDTELGLSPAKAFSCKDLWQPQ